MDGARRAGRSRTKFGIIQAGDSFSQGAAISTRFILIRHGETAWNTDDRFRGRSDVPLNDTGMAQARSIAKRLADYKIAGVYSSPLPRAVQTALPLAQSHKLEIEESADLLDVDYGAWEGMARENIRATYHDLHETWVKTPGRVKFPGGESLKEVRLRVENLLSDLLEDHFGETVALVSHRVTCHVALCVALGLPNDSIWHLRQDVGCINEFEERDGVYVVTLMNDTDHLQRE
jgi:broad specificity phosphatase PhoE